MISCDIQCQMSRLKPNYLHLRPGDRNVRLSWGDSKYIAPPLSLHTGSPEDSSDSGSFQVGATGRIEAAGLSGVLPHSGMVAPLVAIEYGSTTCCSGCPKHTLAPPDSWIGTWLPWATTALTGVNSGARFGDNIKSYSNWNMAGYQEAGSGKQLVVTSQEM